MEVRVGGSKVRIVLVTPSPKILMVFTQPCGEDMTGMAKGRSEKDASQGFRFVLFRFSIVEWRSAM